MVKVMDKADRSIEDLEGKAWGDAPSVSSNLVRRCYALRLVPLRELTPEEVGLAIRQKVGLPHILDIAVGFVRDNLLVQGEFYPGDILVSLANLSEAEWIASPRLMAQFGELHSRALAQIKQAVASHDEAEADDWTFLAELLNDQP